VLSLVLPTYNEAANLPRVIPLLQKTLEGIPHEIIIVDDDSPDGTWKIAEDLAAKHPSVRVLRRVGRRGLSSAVVEGFAMAKGEVLMVMDSDGQHDASLPPALYTAIRAGAKVAVASRYIEGGGMGGWKGMRLFMSRAATFLARKLPNVQVSDPMSGFFALDAEAYRKIAPKLHPRGFKILLEILRYLPKGSATADIPMTFALRKAGQSKMSLGVQMAFISQMAGIARQRMCSVWGLFWLLCLLMFIALLFMLSPIRSLYLDAAVRAQVMHVLQEASVSEGWLLSDITVDEVRPGYLRVGHREHMRGDDAFHCHVFRLPSAQPEPCES
jgi:dolichol-phosphate mannosyltransferase